MSRISCALECSKGVVGDGRGERGFGCPKVVKTKCFPLVFQWHVTLADIEALRISLLCEYHLRAGGVVWLVGLGIVFGVPPGVW